MARTQQSAVKSTGQSIRATPTAARANASNGEEPSAKRIRLANDRLERIDRMYRNYADTATKELRAIGVDLRHKDHKIEDLTNKIITLEKEKVTLTDQNTAFEKVILNLNADNRGLRLEVSELGMTVINLQNENTAMTEKSGHTKDKMVTLAHRLTGEVLQIQDLKDKIVALEEEVQQNQGLKAKISNLGTQLAKEKAKSSGSKDVLQQLKKIKKQLAGVSELVTKAVGEDGQSESASGSDGLGRRDREREVVVIKDELDEHL